MKQWLKDNVLSELPIIGSLSKEKDWSHILRHGTKMTCQFTGSLSSMILYMSRAEMPMVDDISGMANYYTKLALLMAIGEMIGGLAYNTAASVIENIYGWWTGKQQTPRLMNNTPASDDENSHPAPTVLPTLSQS